MRRLIRVPAGLVALLHARLDDAHSGIVPLAGSTITAAPDEVCRRFYTEGVAFTAYEEGVLRLAAPPAGLSTDGLERFRTALGLCR